ncbi:hypothetical protein IT575_06440 [bacterium]|nr:hypothetical protein [bacterium]
MRLLITGMWVLAAVLWLGWGMLLLRLLFDAATGTSILSNPLFNTVFIPAWPVSNQLPLGPWRMVSWWPVCALLSMLLVGIGWRLYWKNEDGLLYRSGLQIFLSIIIPPLAPFMMYSDSVRRFKEGNKRFGVVQ